MLRIVFTGIILINWLVVPALTAAQDVPIGKWWYNPEIQKKLKLSRNEISKLDKLFANSRRKLIKLKSEVENEQFELDHLLSKKKINDTQVKQQFKKLEQARQNLANERLQFVIGVRNILGADRFQQLKSNYKKWQ